jgi:hypothetical protein
MQEHTMARKRQRTTRSAAKVPRSVVVVCEDAAAHALALGVCDQLVKDYWTAVEFEFQWWQFAGLVEPDNALAAACAAADADMILFATHPEGDLPDTVKSWIEVWLDKRGAREGSLIGLTGMAAEAKGGATGKHIYLREVAHRAKMDFLLEIPRLVPGMLPDNIDWVAQRAGQVTSVLDEILRRSAPPQLPPL